MSIISKMVIAVRKPVIMVVAKPTPVTFIGAGKVKEVAGLLVNASRKKVLVITDSFLHGAGLLDTMLAGIKEAGLETVIYDGVKPDPTFGIVAEAQGFAAGCDCVVAVGGGSVIDTAKSVAASVANDKPADRLAGLLKVKKHPLMLIAVPTTAGTGSETTVAAVISDTITHAKKQILDPKIVPIAAVLDPELTVGLPPHTTAFTAMDALTHSLEAYVATYATGETDLYAEMSVKMIYENLPIVHKEPTNLAAREALLVASFLGGMAFTRTYVGYVHAFAHTIGGKFGVPHGLGNAVLLPHIMEYYLPVSQQRFAHLAELTGISHAESEEQRARDFVQSIFDLNDACGVPRRLEKFPVEAIDSVIEVAFKECHGVYPVPRYYNKAEARALLQKVCSAPA